MGIHELFPYQDWDLKSSELLLLFSQKQWSALMASGQRSLLAKGELLFKQDEPAGDVYYVHRGNLKLTGFGQTVYMAGPGEFVGYQQVFSGDRHAATWLAFTDVDLTVIPGDKLMDFIDAHHEIKIGFLRMVSRHQAVFTNFYALFAHACPNQLVATVLLILSKKLSSEELAQFSFGIPCLEVAGMTSLTEVETAEVTDGFEFQGIIELVDDEIWIFDPLRLAELAMPQVNVKPKLSQ